MVKTALFYSIVTLYLGLHPRINETFFFYRYGEIGYKYNSGRKLAQNVSKTGPKFATSSAKKKVVMNSTSEAENVVPTDWDASAIVPPGQVQSNKGKS